MVSVDASDRRFARHEPIKDLRARSRWRPRLDAGQEYDASLRYLVHLRVTVQFADEPVAILGGPISEFVDEGLDEVSTSLAKGFGPTEICRIAFYKRGIELVFADQQAEAVAETRLAVGVAVVSVRGRRVLIRSVSTRRPRRTPE